ncbi:MAG: virulence RhuM family protein [Oscillospiraceae bacterium]|nr:virulence RhuM family protein [Oscillospiraceae bacterium]
MHIEVRFDEDTVWLTQQQMSLLFNHSKQNISLHINNIFREGELIQNSVVKDYLTTATDGKNYKVKYYNLDVIISVGYRVKSVQGTQFRIWATSKLKDYLLKGYAMNNRLNRIENRVDEIELQLNTKHIPTQGVFFDGQMFDAYELVSKIIRTAKQSIILIDNYIDETTLIHLAKKNKDVKVLLLTQSINKQLNLDVQKVNSQYGGFIVKEFNKSHDRFLIIDSGKEIYHIGASLKDLGKKWFAFSKLDKESVASILTAVSDLV